jgi:tetratricopeptide (TPR) repeat protein
VARIYLSSTYLDLKEHRKAVDDALRRLRHQVIGMEDYVASDERPVEMCLRDVSECDIYVGIFAWRFGFAPTELNPDGRSITELEYRKAMETDKHPLVFLLDEKAPWPRSFMEEVTHSAGDGARIRALRDELSLRHTVSFFDSPEDLAVKVTPAVILALGRLQEQALAKERDDRVAESELRRAERQHVVGLHPQDLGDHFKGRTQEMLALSRLLAEPSSRVVTVVGRSGIGKTALAGRVMKDLEHNRWPHTTDAAPVDGIVYLSRSPTTDITLERLFLLCTQILAPEQQDELNRVWGSTSLSTPEKIERLLEAMARGVYVIMLDHVEGLLDTDGRIQDPELQSFFERSLSAPQGARLLLTSRDPLAFPPEALAFDKRLPLTEGLTTDEGVAILRELDPSGQGGLRDLPDDRLRAAVDQLHGFPRALELLAGALRDEPLSSLEDVLGRFYQQDAAAALVQEAYRRLDEHERQVMAAIAVLGRPVTPVAVQFMVEPLAPGLNTDAVIRGLIQAQLVKADRASKTLSLAAIDQDYVASQIPQQGPFSQPALELRAAEYYSQLRTPPGAWSTLLDVESQLLEFEHRMNAGDVDGAASVLFEVDEFLTWNGHARRALQMHDRLAGMIVNRSLLMRNAFGVGRAKLVQGPLAESIESMQSARAMAVELGDAEVERLATRGIGEAYRRLGRLDEAIDHLERAVASYRPTAAPIEQSGMLELGLAYAYRGRVQDASRCGERLLGLASAEPANVRAVAEAHDILSLAALVAGSPEDAVEHATKAVGGYRETHQRDPEGYTLNVLGMACLGLGRLDEGIGYLAQGRALGKDENPRLEGFCLFNTARALWLKEDPAKALEAADSAAAIFERLGAPEAPTATSLGTAIRASQGGDAAAAARALLECARASSATPDLLQPSDLIGRAEAIAGAQASTALADEVKGLRNWIRSRVVPPG